MVLSKQMSEALHLILPSKMKDWVSQSAWGWLERTKTGEGQPGNRLLASYIQTPRKCLEEDGEGRLKITLNFPTAGINYTQ